MVRPTFAPVFISVCRFSGEVPAALMKQPNLHHLGLHSNPELAGCLLECTRIWNTLDRNDWQTTPVQALIGTRMKFCQGELSIITDASDSILSFVLAECF